MKRSLLFLFLFVAAFGFVSAQNAVDLFFSEYVEGSSNNKYLEIFNGTGASVDLTDYQVLLFANGATTATNTETLSGNLADGEVLVIANSSANIYSGTVLSSSTANFNGNDAVALKKISTNSYVDIIGCIGESVYWTSASNSLQDRTIVRKAFVAGGVTTNPTSGFPTLEDEWVGYPKDNIDNLGTHNFSPTPSTAELSNFQLSSSTVETGQEVTFTWDATDVELINFQSWEDEDQVWEDIEGLTGIDATLETVNFTIPLDATDDANAKLRIVDASNPAVFAESQVFELKDVHFAGLDITHPENGAVNVPTDLFIVTEGGDVVMNHLLIVFNEDVQANTGTIELYEVVAGGSDVLVSSFDIATEVDVYWETVAINLGGNLDPNTEYRVEVPADGFYDTAAAQNGNSAITWTFTTGDGDSHVTIYDIRGESAGAPAMMGETVLTSGIVTGIISGQGFFLQDANTAWSGIYVYDSDVVGNVTVGDFISLVGTVGEFYNLAQIQNLLTYQIGPNNGVPFAPVVVTMPFAEEQWESMLVTVENVQYTDASINFGEFEITDGTNTGLVDEAIYEHTPSTSEEFESITGIMNYTYSAFKIAPRSAADIVSIPTAIAKVSIEGLDIWPNPAKDVFYISSAEDLSSIELVNMAGQTLKIINPHTSNSVPVEVSDLPRGIYLLRLVSHSGVESINKIILE